MNWQDVATKHKLGTTDYQSTHTALVRLIEDRRRQKRKLSHLQEDLVLMVNNQLGDEVAKREGGIEWINYAILAVLLGLCALYAFLP